MKVFVTGAAGVIGWELVKELAYRGNEVIGYVRRIPDHLYHPGVTWVVGDLFQKERLSISMAHCDEVYHVAAFTKLHSKHTKDIFKTNVEGTISVLNAALEAGVGKFCFTSTCGVLDGAENELLTEHHINPGVFRNNYDLSKFMAEQKVLEYIREGLNARIVRVSRVFGPAQLRYSNATTRLINAYLHALAFFWPGNGNAVGNYAYIKDVVHGHINAMHYGLPGERYNLGGHNLSYRELITAINKLTGKSTLCVGVSLAASRWLVGIDSWLTAIAGVAPHVKQTDLDGLFKSKPISIQKAMSEIRFRVTPLEEALATTISFLDPSIPLHRNPKSLLLL